MQSPFQGGAATFVPGATSLPPAPMPRYFANPNYAWGSPQILFPSPNYPGPPNFFGASGGGDPLPPIGPAPAQNSPPFRRYGKKQPVETFQPGAVIAVPYHTIDFMQPPIKSTRDESLSRLGWVHTKERRLIVIDSFNDHCVGIPMATHNNTGLRSKKAKGEWIGVRDSADPDIQSSESAHGNILATRDSRFALPASPQNPWWTKNTTYAHFSCPVSFLYDRGCIYVGNIANPDHLKKLKELYHRHCPKKHVVDTLLVAKNADGVEEAFGEEGEERDWWKAAIERRQQRVKNGTASA